MGWVVIIGALAVTIICMMVSTYEETIKNLRIEIDKRDAIIDALKSQGQVHHHHHKDQE